MQLICTGCQAKFKLQPEVLRANNTRSFNCPKCSTVVVVPEDVFSDKPFAATQPPSAIPGAAASPAPAPPAAAAPAAEPKPAPAQMPPPSSAPTEKHSPVSTATAAPTGTMLGMQALSMDPEPVPPGFNFSLVCMSGPTTGEKRGIDRTPWVVGRDEGEWTTHDPHMSRRHFHVLIRGTDISVSDLGSTNGTFVNGNKVDGLAHVSNRDEIRAGSSTFLFVAVAQSDLEADQAKEEEMEMEAPLPADEAKLLSDPALATQMEGAPAQSHTYTQIPANFRIFLQVVDGPDKEMCVDLTGKQTLVIGRGKDADFTLSDQTCSRKHCQIMILGMNEYILRDLASTNGTFMENRRIMQEKLKNLDVFQLGKTRIRFNALKAAW